MPKQTAEVFFPKTPEQVWDTVTNPATWLWPGGPKWIHHCGNDLEIVTEDKDGLKTIFHITAFAPARWFAVRLENKRVTGRCEVLFFRQERGGTKVEFTADVQGKTPVQRLLLSLRLGQWQQQCLQRFKRILK